jgi:two-component system OmpR family sensor kinase
MSSSPPTDVTERHPARWRSPAGWPLRTRIVAIMIVLLAVLGLAVGGTAEVILRHNLYQQIDTRVEDAQHRSFGYFNFGQKLGAPRSGLAPSGSGNQEGGPPGGLEAGTVLLQMEPGTTEVTALSGVVRESGSFREQSVDHQLPTDALAALKAVPLDSRAHNVNLGSMGDYRVIGGYDQDDVPTITGLKLDDLEATLVKVTAVTGGAILVALLIAGWAGAFIVRRTLAPLDRVAATATRVSELELDRGEVELAQRVPAGDTDPRTEVGQVGSALNRLLDHVRDALEARHASETQVRQFVADASHELRTPLAAIRGYAELSRRSRQPVSAETAHVLSRVESEAKRMTLLVEDLLLLARLDAGRPLAQDPVDLTMLVVDAVSDAHAAGPSHYWRLAVPDEPVVVVGDGSRLHQVLANLLANARTHTPEGTAVTVSVEASHGAAILRVIDHGPGIPADLQPHIFERFARGDSSRSRAAGSTGLGLSIVHAVVTSHGGKVAVQSVPGQTVFTVLLPLMPVPMSPVPATEQFAQLAPGRR